MIIGCKKELKSLIVSASPFATLPPVTRVCVLSKLENTDFNLDIARATETLVVGGTIACKILTYVE